MAVPSILLLLFLPILGIDIPNDVGDVYPNARILGAETVVLNEMNNIKNDEACQDCIHIIELLKHLLSDKDFQNQVQMRLKGTLEGVCDLLPEQIKDQCHSEMDKDLPLVLTFLVGLMKPGQMCTYLNLCEGEFKLQMEDILMNYVQKTITPTSVMLEASFPCKTCTFALNVLNCLLPTTETESVLISVLDEACSVLPMVLSGQCSRLVQRSLKKLFEVLLNAKSPNSICSVLRLCQSSLPLVASPLSDCDSCQTLVILSRLRLGSNATQSQVTSFMSSVCQSHPGILPKCESFTQRYGEQLRWILGKEAVALDVCERVDLCVKSRRTEQGDVGDPCTLGPSYSCQDLQTAHTCGVISFCQMNVWK